MNKILIIQIINLKVERSNIIAFGIYTLSNNILKLSVQTYPLYPNESRFISFQIKTNDKPKLTTVFTFIPSLK